MCYAKGSIDQATKICPMCKVFRPSGARCPHVRDVCHNRALHPRHDVVYLKNAEVQSFNGCGFCKWAKSNPPLKQSGWQNPGWPGCCRPPSTSEMRLIQAADWPAVNIVHHVPIPPEIQSLLDSISPRGPYGSVSRSTGAQLSAAPLDRKGSGNCSPSSKSNLPLGKPAASKGSPQQLAASLANLNLRSSASPSSAPNPPIVDQHQSPRRSTHPDYVEKRLESHSSNTSPNRKYTDLDGSVARRNSSSRPSIPISMTGIKGSSEAYSQAPQRRASISGSNPTQSRSQPSSSRAAERPSTASNPRFVKKPSEMSSATSSSGSSDGTGSLSDNTVTSDGGFTDYLSDESEAELNRQAEAKAALVAQTQAEELEFKAARQQLAHVDLRPPKSWNPAAGVSSSRLGSSSLSSAYGSGSGYANPHYASSAVAHSRG